MLTLRKKFWPPSSSGLGPPPLTAVAWVRIPSGVQTVSKQVLHLPRPRHVGVSVNGNQYVPAPYPGQPGPMTVKVRSPAKLPSPLGVRESDLVVVTALPSSQWNGYSPVDSHRSLTHR